jgi:DUF4097 and DUF4098 domain-containing protein YvlB
MKKLFRKQILEFPPFTPSLADLRNPLCAVLLFVLFTWTASAEEFLEESEKLIPLRSSGSLQILNNRGDIVIEGWSQDKIRLKLNKKTISNDPVEAKRLLGSAGIQHREIDGGVEISAEYGRGLTLQERLRERDNPKTSMEMILSAPARAPLQILAFSGKVILRQWRGTVQIRSGAGSIHIENSRGDGIFVLCPSCAISASAIHASLRCVGGDKPVILNGVQGDEIYVETGAGEVRAHDIRGEQLYVSKTGAIKIQKSRGHVEFNSRDSEVDIDEVYGFVSGRTASGNITARIRDWVFHDRAFIESSSGNIVLELPHAFSGEVDLTAPSGKLMVGSPFDLKLNSLTRLSGRSSAPSKAADSFSGHAHLSGVLGLGGDQLRVVSERGYVRLSAGN